jgi:acetyl esterase
VGQAAVVEHSYVYGTAGGRPLSLLAFLPGRHRGPVPGVLVIHGGGWNQGTAQGFSSAAEALAESGLAAFDVDYRLDRPGSPGFPDQTNQLVSAVEWLHRHGPGLGVDPRRLGALGSSAGGNLAGLLALALGHHPHGLGPLGAVVSWSGPMQLGAIAGPGWLRADLLDYVGCPPARCPGRWRLASPADQVGPLPTAWLLFNSRSELIPLAGAQSMLGALHRAGDDARLVVYAGRRHAGGYQDQAMTPTIAFLRAHLGVGATRG